MRGVFDFLFGSESLAAVGSGMAWRAVLVQPTAFAGLAVAAALLVVAIAIEVFVRSRCDISADGRRLARLVSFVLVAAAAAELTGVATVWQPVYGLHIVMKGLFALLILGAMVTAWRILPAVVAMPSRSTLADANQRLEALNTDLEARVEARTRELAEAKERFEAALSGSRISVATQDRDLFYRWVHNPPLGLAPEDLLGHADEDILDSGAAAHLRSVKFGVMGSGEPASTEIEAQDRERGRIWLRVHVSPYCPAGRAPEGVTVVVVDITDERRRAEMLEHVTQALAEANARFDTALAGSNITMFRQDRDLRYTWMHNPPVGMTAAHFLGQDDDAALPEAAARMVTPMKRRVLETSESERGEVSIKICDVLHWFDLRIEPFFERGRVAGVMCVAIDITGQKEYQQQLKVVMRELTHRSKNLLAVVQGIARQTAQTVDDLPAFVDRFGARLQALARAHDVLVDESWRGASIDELVASQLGHVMETTGDRLDEGGERVMLKPEAAQNVALALHELATNAAKYGALSTSDGRVAVRWGVRAVEPADERGQIFEITWKEQGGPPVEEPRRKGFGRMMIERLVPRAIDGTSELVFDPDGIRWTLRFPTEYLTEDGKGPTSGNV